MPDNSLLGDINEELEDTQKNIGLLDFDKFNILDKGVTEGQADDEITKALTDELEKQQEIYNQISTSIKDMSNDAVKIGENIRNWFIETDAEGNFEKWTTQAKGLLAVITSIGLAKIFTIGGEAKGAFSLFKNLSFAIEECRTSTKGLSSNITLLGKAFSLIQNHPIILVFSALAGILIYIYTTNEQFRKSIGGLFTAINKLIGTALEPLIKTINGIITALSWIIDNIIAPVLSFVVNVITKIIEFVNNLHILDGALWVIIGTIGFIFTLKIIDGIYSLIKNIGTLITTIKALSKSLLTLGKNIGKFLISPVGVVIMAVTLLVSNIGMLIHGWDDMSGWQKAVGIIGAVAGAIMLVVSAIAAFHGTWSLGTAIAAITAGLVAVGSAIAIYWTNAQKSVSESIPKFEGSFANGGVIPNKGSIFQAGEAGTELVYNMGGGSTGVANVEQLQQAVFNGTMQAILATGLNDPTNINVNLDSDLDGFARLLTPRINIEKARGGYR